MSCKCQKCGRQYLVDIIIPDNVWLKISPKKSESGLLCGKCIMNEIENMKEYNVFNLVKVK